MRKMLAAFHQSQPWRQEGSKGWRKLGSLMFSWALLMFPLNNSLMGPSTSSVAAAAPALVQTQSTNLPLDQLIIQFKTAVSASSAADAQQAAVSQQLDVLSQVAGQTLSYDHAMSGAAYVLKLPEKLPAADVQAIADKLMARAAALGIAYVEPDAHQYALLAPNDTQYGEQWNYQAPSSAADGINLPAAWDLSTGAASVVVAVIDTGIRFDHPDLAGRTVAGYDFVSDVQAANDGDGRDSDPSDPGDWITAAEARTGYFRGCEITSSSWHGSHVAGIIGAASNNGVGVAGINWQAKLQSVRVLGKCGGLLSDIVDGIRWAAGIDVSGVPHNTTSARVINLSLGGTGACSTTEQKAINDVVSRGVTVVVAAGNDNQDVRNSSPANCANVISVAATNRAGARAFYSDYGAGITLSAPGGGSESDPNDAILSTVNTGTQGPIAPGYAYYIGTSMAAPHVAGVVSLMVGLDSTLTPATIAQYLQSTATGFPTGSSCLTKGCGAGIVNAAAALTAVSNQVQATPTATTAPTATTPPTLTPIPLTAVPTVTPLASSTPINSYYLPIIQNH